MRFLSSRTGRPLLTLAALALVLLSWLASPLAASAHARLARTNPAAGSLLDTAPTEIQLFMSEGASLEFSTITLYDRTRKEHPTGPLGRVDGDDTTVRAPIIEALAPGTYTVVWRVLSSVDGHLTAGSFAFRVRGTGAEGSTDNEPIVPLEGNTSAPLEGTVENANPLRWSVRTLILACAVLLLGGPVFTLLVVDPTIAETARNGEALSRVAGRKYARVGTIAAMSLLLLLVLDLLLEIAAIRGTNLFGSLAHGDSALLVLNSTRYGFAWLLKVLSALLLMGMMLFAWQVSRKGGGGIWEIAIAAASLLFLAQALGSHGAAVSAADSGSGLPIPIASDWLHLVTAGIWMGGLGYLALALFPAFRAVGMNPEERRAFLGRSIPRFSMLAMISVAVLAITGTYNLIIHSTDLGAIIGSEYGQVLAIKIVAFGVLVVLGAMNLLRLTPMLKAKAAAREARRSEQQARNNPGDPDNIETQPVRQLGRNIRAEIVLGVAALICAGGLSLLPPPTGAGAIVGSPTTTANGQPGTTAIPVPPTPGPATASSQVGGYNFTLTTRPSLEGDQLTLVLDKTDPAAAPLTDVAKVLFKVTPQDIDAGSISYEATPQGELRADSQIWTATEPILTIDGEYMITTIVQRTVADDVKAAFRLNLSEEQGLQASAGQVVDVRLLTDPSPPLTGTAAVTITLLDGARRPIEGAKLTVSPLMPAHAHIEPQAVASPVPGQPGAYTTTVKFPMGGAWLFIFYVERDGLPPVKIDASLDVEDPFATPTPEVPQTNETPPTPTGSP